jgi:hypothetical protein
MEGRLSSVVSYRFLKSFRQLVRGVGKVDPPSGIDSSLLGCLRNSPNDGASVPALHVQAIPIDGRSKFLERLCAGVL